MKIRVYFLLLLFVVALSGFVNSQSLSSNFRSFVINTLARRTIDEPRLLRSADRKNKIQDKISDSVKFPCKDRSLFRSKTKPTSVHMLRPGDIDLIGAMGDSLTAANGAGATIVPQVLQENRGVSWSIGGKSNWREFLTLPNILKEFNPNLIGFAKGDSLGYEKLTQFNSAELGAMSMDFPHMVRELVKRIKRDPRVDVENDWKLITIMMGANDFCFNMCYYPDPYVALERHRNQLSFTISHLMKNLPRTLINIVPAPDVFVIKTYRDLPPICSLTHKLFCPCIFSEARKSSWSDYQKVVKKWQKLEKEVAENPKYIKDDFAVVYQPFTLNINLTESSGQTDYSLLSADCFHFSQKGHASAANMLWNNMMQPVGSKDTFFPGNLFENLECPTKTNPFITTKKNSGNIFDGNRNSDDFKNEIYKRHVLNNA